LLKDATIMDNFGIAVDFTNDQHLDLLEKWQEMECPLLDRFASKLTISASNER